MSVGDTPSELTISSRRTSERHPSSIDLTAKTVIPSTEKKAYSA